MRLRAPILGLAVLLPYGVGCGSASFSKVNQEDTRQLTRVTDAQSGRAANSIVVSDLSGHIRVIDPYGTVKRRWSIESAISKLAVSGDGRLVAAGDIAGRILIIDVEDGVITKTFLAHSQAIRGIAFASPSSLVTTVGNGVVVWDLEKLKPKRTIHNPSQHCLIGSFEGNPVFAASIWRSFACTTPQVSAMDVSPDGTLLAVAVYRRVIVLRISDGRTLNEVEAYASSLAFSPKGEQLAIGLRSGRIELCDWKQGQITKAWPAHESSSIAALSYAPDGMLLASTSFNGDVAVFDTATGAIRTRIKAGQEAARLAWFPGPQARKLFIGTANGQLLVSGCGLGE